MKTKKCPYCQEEIAIKAFVCPHCRKTVGEEREHLDGTFETKATIVCPNCERGQFIKVANAGKTIRCTFCQEEFEVPEDLKAAASVKGPDEVGWETFETVSDVVDVERERDLARPHYTPPEPRKPEAGGWRALITILALVVLLGGVVGIHYGVVLPRRREKARIEKEKKEAAAALARATTQAKGARQAAQGALAEINEEEAQEFAAEKFNEAGEEMAKGEESFEAKRMEEAKGSFAKAAALAREMTALIQAGIAKREAAAALREEADRAFEAISAEQARILCPAEYAQGRDLLNQGKQSHDARDYEAASESLGKAKDLAAKVSELLALASETGRAFGALDAGEAKLLVGAEYDAARELLASLGQPSEERDYASTFAGFGKVKEFASQVARLVVERDNAAATLEAIDPAAAKEVAGDLYAQAQGILQSLGKPDASRSYETTSQTLGELKDMLAVIDERVATKLAHDRKREERKAKDFGLLADGAKELNRPSAMRLPAGLFGREDPRAKATEGFVDSVDRDTRKLLSATLTVAEMKDGTKAIGELSGGYGTTKFLKLKVGPFTETRQLERSETEDVKERRPRKAELSEFVVGKIREDYEQACEGAQWLTAMNVLGQLHALQGAKLVGQDCLMQVVGEERAGANASFEKVAFARLAKCIEEALAISQTCRPCKGTANVRCSECKGEGEIPETCPTCRGRRGFPCRNCGGDGKLTCARCGGDRSQRCVQCNGSGKRQGATGMRRCVTCGGRGKLNCSLCGGRGVVSCRACRGSGLAPCKTCGGKGVVFKPCPVCGSREEKLRGTVSCPKCEGTGKIVDETEDVEESGRLRGEYLGMMGKTLDKAVSSEGAKGGK